MANNSEGAPGRATTQASPYERIGGAPTVRAGVDELYRRLLDDPELAGYFDGVELPRLKAHMADLLTTVLGGPDKYAGRELEEAHRGLGITEAHYRMVGEHLVAVLEGAGAPDDVVAAVGDTLAAVSDQIIEHR